MARADSLKRLFKSYKNGDNASFLEVARNIIEDERKKNHALLADELSRIIDNSRSPLVPTPHNGLATLPKDSDRGSTLLEIRRPDRFFRDLVLPDEHLRVLHEALDGFRQWEILETHALRPSNKMLFCGPTGCGKTVTAEAIAAELGLPLLHARFDAVVSSLLGETAANLGKVFDYASRGTWVLLFDEFDAIGRSRDDVTEHGELKRVVNTFLQLLDRFPGRSMIVAATNFEEALDPALWRRFDEVIRFGKPSASQIEELVNKLIGHRLATRAVPPSTYTALAGKTHAEVERVCLDAVKTAVLSGRAKVTEEDVEHALQRQELRQQALGKARPSDAPRVDIE